MIVAVPKNPFFLEWLGPMEVSKWGVSGMGSRYTDNQRRENEPGMETFLCMRPQSFSASRILCESEQRCRTLKNNKVQATLPGV